MAEIRGGPLVAVIMTCYNEGPYIGAAVRSVLNQSLADRIDQIVIADDGSLKDTVDILREIETWDPRISIIYGEGGVGLPGQRCRAIAETVADYIAILDGDDLWTPEKLASQIVILETLQDVGLVYADYYTFPDEDLGSARRAGVKDITRSRRLVREYFLNDPPIIPSTTLLRRTDYFACGGFDPATRIFEDTDFYIRLAAITRFALIDRPLLYKRNRKTSITGGRSDLLAHHAYVSLKAAAHDPRLLPLVPERIAERARKLGNNQYLLNDLSGALTSLKFAVRLNPFNFRAWASLIAVRFFPILAMRLLGSRGRERKSALGL